MPTAKRIRKRRAALELLWTERAIRDLEKIDDYIAEDSPAAAARRVAKLIAIAATVPSAPRSRVVWYRSKVVQIFAKCCCDTIELFTASERRESTFSRFLKDTSCYRRAWYLRTTNGIGVVQPNLSVQLTSNRVTRRSPTASSVGAINPINAGRVSEAVAQS
jgi:hypothetical protein